MWKSALVDNWNEIKQNLPFNALEHIGNNCGLSVSHYAAGFSVFVREIKCKGHKNTVWLFNISDVKKLYAAVQLPT